MQERSGDTVPRPEPPRGPTPVHVEHRPSQRERVWLSLLLRPDGPAETR